MYFTLVWVIMIKSCYSFPDFKETWALPRNRWNIYMAACANKSEEIVPRKRSDSSVVWKYWPDHKQTAVVWKVCQVCGDSRSTTPLSPHLRQRQQLSGTVSSPRTSQTFKTWVHQRWQSSWDGCWAHDWKCFVAVPQIQFKNMLVQIIFRPHCPALIQCSSSVCAASS